jgi:N-acetylglucosamine-6-phosphate deacetylase
VHVHDALTRLVLRDAPTRTVLITDAISATGAPDGEYVLGGQPVVSREGTVRVVGTGRLAGSTLTMDAALRRTVLDLGLPITLAVAAASANPARALGVDDRCGSITAGLVADLVHLDADLRVRRVMVGGEWVDLAQRR